MSPVTSRATTSRIAASEASLATTTAVWNPNDYVDDNYEPQAYVPPAPPLAVLVPHELSKYNKHDRPSKNGLVEEKTHRDHKTNVGNTAESAPTSASALQTTSSHVERAPAASPPPPREAPAPACAPSRSSHCRTRA